MSQRRAILVYAHQLFDKHPGLAIAPGAEVVVAEDPLLYTQYAFSPGVIAYRRATVAAYRRDMEKRGHQTQLIAVEDLPTSDAVFHQLSSRFDEILVADPCDDWIEKSIEKASRGGQRIRVLDSPGFLLARSDLDSLADRRSMASFYPEVRKNLGVLLDPDGGPRGGQWSFDRDNRKRIPKRLDPPPAIAPGDNTAFPYPTSRSGALFWLDEFLKRRLALFGPYEDAIDERDDRWYHSLLTPMLNAGVITPREVLDRTLAFADSRERDGDPIPLNSLEGFVRQLIGWREYMRATYRSSGGFMRGKNYWDHKNTMPQSFYDGTTGLIPFDRVVDKVKRLGWAHHIERLMIAGSLMLLCEIDPDAVFRWFMELFVDAWDWVMVPNVYAMSQYADGGSITTKPYLSGSSYIKRMSDSPRGDWEQIWDGLFWRFIDRHRDEFAANHRTSMMAVQLDRLNSDRRATIFGAAERFLNRLW